MSQEFPSNPTIQALRDHAMQYPEAEEGDSCVKKAYGARKKNYLFIGSKDDTYNIMVKLTESLDEASALEAKEAEHYKVGLHGWTTITFEHGQTPPAGLLERWIDESYRAVAPKRLAALLDEQPVLPAPASAKKAAVKKKTTRKRANKKA